MPNVLSPNDRKLDTFKDYKNLSKARHEDIAGEDGEDDPRMIKEIRKRIVDMAREFEKLGVI